MRAVSGQESAFSSQKSKQDTGCKIRDTSIIYHVSCIMYRASLLLFAVCLISASCGKKGPPTLKSYEKPDAPADLKAIHREGSILLSWSYNKKENLKCLHIFRSEDADFQRIASVPKDENSYNDINFKKDVFYKYKVVAQSLREVLSDDSNVVMIKPVPVPHAPKNISFRIGNSNLSILWEGEGEGILYNIYKSYERGEYSINPVNNEPLKATSYADNLELTKPVYYTVRGLLNNESRNEGSASDEIEVNPLNFVPSSPRGLEKVLMEDKVVLLWKENPETWVMKYRIYRKIDDKGGFKLIGESVTPTFTDRGETGVRHFYKITAVGPAKESEFSETVAVDF